MNDMFPIPCVYRTWESRFDDWRRGTEPADGTKETVSPVKSNTKGQAKDSLSNQNKVPSLFHVILLVGDVTEEIISHVSQLMFGFGEFGVFPTAKSIQIHQQKTSSRHHRTPPGLSGFQSNEDDPNGPMMTTWEMDYANVSFQPGSENTAAVSAPLSEEEDFDINAQQKTLAAACISKEQATLVSQIGQNAGLQVKWYQVPRPETLAVQLTYGNHVLRSASSLWSTLRQLTLEPSYIRFLRDENGLPRNILCLKYPSVARAVLGVFELSTLHASRHQILVASRGRHQHDKRSEEEDDGEVSETLRDEASMDETVRSSSNASVNNNHDSPDGLKLELNESFETLKEIIEAQMDTFLADAQYNMIEYELKDHSRSCANTISEVAMAKGLKSHHSVVNARMLRFHRNKIESNQTASTQQTPSHGPSLSATPGQTNGDFSFQFRGAEYWKSLAQRTQQEKAMVVRAPGPGSVTPWCKGRGKLPC